MKFSRKCSIITISNTFPWMLPNYLLPTNFNSEALLISEEQSETWNQKIWLLSVVTIIPKFLGYVLLENHQRLQNLWSSLGLFLSHTESMHLISDITLSGGTRRILVALTEGLFKFFFLIFFRFGVHSSVNLRRRSERQIHIGYRYTYINLYVYLQM